jgi:hypothetical protein
MAMETIRRVEKMMAMMGEGRLYRQPAPELTAAVLKNVCPTA